MRTPSPRQLALIAAPAATAWLAAYGRDRRRLAADPERHALAELPAGREASVRSADGTRLQARVFGPDTGPTVVLVHGWTCTHRFWVRQIRELARSLRIVAYDLRGHGESEAPEASDYSTDALAADLDAVLAQLVPRGERPVVAGHSLGAMSIVAWAGVHPERVPRQLAGAVLVNTGIGDLVTEALLLRAPSALGRGRQVAGRAVMSVKAPVPKRSTPISSRAVHYVALGPDASPAQVAFCETMFLNCRRDVRAACGGTLSTLELSHAVERLDVPVAVIAGERDRLTPPAHSRRLAAALPQLAVHDELARVGHMAPVEAPDAVTGRIRELAAGGTERAGLRAAA